MKISHLFHCFLLLFSSPFYGKCLNIFFSIHFYCFPSHFPCHPNQGKWFFLACFFSSLQFFFGNQPYLLKKLKFFKKNIGDFIPLVFGYNGGLLNTENRFLHPKRIFQKRRGPHLSMISFYKSSSLIDASYSYERAGFQQAFLQAFFSLIVHESKFSWLSFFSIKSSIEEYSNEGS